MCRKSRLGRIDIISRSLRCRAARVLDRIWCFANSAALAGCRSRFCIRNPSISSRPISAMCNRHMNKIAMKAEYFFEAPTDQDSSARSRWGAGDADINVNEPVFALIRESFRSVQRIGRSTAHGLARRAPSCTTMSLSGDGKGFGTRCKPSLDGRSLWCFSARPARCFCGRRSGCCAGGVPTFRACATRMPQPSRDAASPFGTSSLGESMKYSAAQLIDDLTDFPCSGIETD